MNKYNLNEFRVGHQVEPTGFSSYFFTTAKLNGPNICICRKPDGHNFVMVYNEGSMEHNTWLNKDYFENKSKPEDYQSVDEMFPDGLTSKLNDWEYRFLNLYLQYGVDIVNHLPEDIHWGLREGSPGFYLITSYPNGMEYYRSPLYKSRKLTQEERKEAFRNAVELSDYLKDKLKDFECRIFCESEYMSYVIFTLKDFEIVSANSKYTLIFHPEYNRHDKMPTVIQSVKLDPWNQEVLESYFKYGEDEFLNHLPEKSELEYEQNDSSKIKLIEYIK